MAQASQHVNELAFYPETTVNTPPGDWGADGVTIEHLSADPASIKQVWLDDPTLEARIMKVGTRDKIAGIRNVDMTVGIKLHGVGEETAAGDQAPNTYLAKILKHTMGGVHRGTSRSVTGGTAVAVQVDNSTGIEVGSLVAFEDTTSPTAANTGRVHFRRVLSIAAGPPIVLTLSEALPFTPANGDAAHAAITGYLDEDVLEDAVASAGGPHTFSWFVKKHKSGTDHLWELTGSVASMQVQGLSRGELPSMQLSIMAANFKHGGADGLTLPTFGAAEGHAQLSMGRNLLCSIQDYGTTTLNLQDVNQVSFEPGFARSKVETTTEKTHGFEGLASYSVTPGKTRFTCTLLPFGDDYYADLHAGQKFRINFYMPGDGSGAGKGFCIHIAKAQLVETPSRAVVGDVQGIQLVFEAQEPDDCTGGSNTNLKLSKFLIGLA